MKGFIVSSLLVLSGAAIFFGVESRPDGMFANNPMDSVVNEIEYLADYIEEQSVPNLNK